MDTLVERSSTLVTLLLAILFQDFIVVFIVIRVAWVHKFVHWPPRVQRKRFVDPHASDARIRSYAFIWTAPSMRFDDPAGI